MYYSDYEKMFFENIEHGTVRFEAVKKALDSAMDNQDAEAALYLYYELMYEDVFHGNCYNSTILFPEYLAYFEKHPELEQEHSHNVMWAYKWVIHNLKNFHQIPLAQIEKIYDQYAVFCKKFGYSMRSYYEFLACFIMDQMEKEQKFCDLTSIEALQKMLKCKRDDLSDCRACELDKQAELSLKIEDDPDKALKIIKPVFDGMVKCAEVPDATYANFGQYYFEKGDLQTAVQYAEKSYRMIDRKYGNDNGLLDYKAICANIIAYANPQKALKMIKKIIPFIENSSNGWDCFEFFLAAYHTMLCLESIGRTKVKINLPFKNDAIYQDSGIYNIEDIKNYMYEKAKYHADRFDARNRNKKYNQRLSKVYQFDDQFSLKKDESLDIPVLQYIEENIDEGILPENFSLPRPSSKDESAFADGTSDGITLYHTEPVQYDIGDLAELIHIAGQGKTKLAAAKIENYFKNSDTKVIYIFETVQNYIIENKENLPAQDIFNLGITLTVHGIHYETVKLGLIILSLFSDFNEHLMEAIITLAACNEFTLFCLMAVEELENANEIKFKMAQNVFGWGKIHTLNHLEPENDEIKEWILYEGIKNNVHPGYSAIRCFQKADVHTRLENGLKQEELTPVGMILMFLIEDGPTIGIEAFEDGDNMIDRYLDSAEKLELSETDRQIIEFISKNYDNDTICQRCKSLLP